MIVEQTHWYQCTRCIYIEHRTLEGSSFFMTQFAPCKLCKAPMKRMPEGRISKIIYKLIEPFKPSKK